MVKNSMLNEEARKKEKGDASSSDVYVAESHGKKEYRRGQARFQQSKDQKSRGRSKSRKRQEITCFIVASQITRRSIAGYTREILQRVKLLTRTSKKARMVLP
jgi:hypothetical protein